VLYATGRVPNANGIGLEAAGVAVNAAGAIQVNEQYQTSVPSIYALGDVTARLQLTPGGAGRGHGGGGRTLRPGSRQEAAQHEL
jgi:glutathione reductase (NADPH)